MHSHTRPPLGPRPWKQHGWLRALAGSVGVRVLAEAHTKPLPPLTQAGSAGRVLQVPGRQLVTQVPAGSPSKGNADPSPAHKLWVPDGRVGTPRDLAADPAEPKVIRCWPFPISMSGKHTGIRSEMSEDRAGHDGLTDQCTCHLFFFNIRKQVHSMKPRPTPLLHCGGKGGGRNLFPQITALPHRTRHRPRRVGESCLLNPPGSPGGGHCWDTCPHSGSLPEQPHLTLGSSSDAAELTKPRHRR